MNSAISIKIRKLFILFVDFGSSFFFLPEIRIEWVNKDEQTECISKGWSIRAVTSSIFVQKDSVGPSAQLPLIPKRRHSGCLSGRKGQHGVIYDSGRCRDQGTCWCCNLYGSAHLWRFLDIFPHVQDRFFFPIRHQISNNTSSVYNINWWDIQPNIKVIRTLSRRATEWDVDSEQRGRISQSIKDFQDSAMRKCVDILACESISLALCY